MSKASATVEDWTGKVFANNWKIEEKLSCAEYREIYQKATGDMTKKIKNAHYRCFNQDCGVESYLERTVIQRALNNGTPVLSKCRGCNKDSNKCYYGKAVREKNLYKVPERSNQGIVGTVYGFFTLDKILPSENFADHQRRAICHCNLCGKEHNCRMNVLLEGSLACDCFRNHSSGEMAVKTVLLNNDISYKAEYTFSDLYDKGKLRYDFALFNKDKLIGLIEYDGEQHFATGGFFNSDGAVQRRDSIKDEYAASRNIPLLRIPYNKFFEVEKLVLDFHSSCLRGLQ